MALRTRNFLLDVLQNDFDEVDEEMFRDVEMSLERIFYIVVLQKSDLDEVAEVILSRRMALRTHN
jgi:hypothetical protein